MGAQQSCDPAKSGYVLHQGVDSPGNDMRTVGRRPCVQIQQCNQSPTCLGFNTNGWLKYNVDGKRPEPRFTRPDQGLWINTARQRSSVVLNDAAAANAASPHPEPVSDSVEEVREPKKVMQTGEKTIQKAMDMIDRLQGKKVSDAHKLTAYRSVMSKFMPPTEMGLHLTKEALITKIEEDPDVKDVMSITGFERGHGLTAVVVQDMNQWAGAISKREGFSGGLVGGFSLQRVLTIAVLAFVFYQVLVNQRQIKAALKKMF